MCDHLSERLALGFRLLADDFGTLDEDEIPVDIEDVEDEDDERTFRATGRSDPGL
jgi:hypothetical protein